MAIIFLQKIEMHLNIVGEWTQHWCNTSTGKQNSSGLGIPKLPKMAAIVSDLPPPPAPILLEADHVSITCAWDKIDGARQFELEMTEVDENGGEVGWQSLSNKLKTNQAKKKNLVPEKRYAFRYRYLADVSASGEEVWSPFSDRSDVLQTVPDSIALMEPPQLVTSDGSSITISWTPLEGTAKYKLRFRRAESVQCWCFEFCLMRSL